MSVTTPPFELKVTLPARGSVPMLRDELIRHLTEHSPPVGSRFLSDDQLTRLTRLSRPTVRRAMQDLIRQGWIVRRRGSGTFIGPRVASPLRGANASFTADRRAIVRLAVVNFLFGDYAHDWYARGIVEGVDQAAYEAGVALELVGDRQGELEQVAARLIQTHPDVVALTAPPPFRMSLVAECRRLQIPCSGTGTMLSALGVPSVHEDGEQGSTLAVQHLAAHGHRRIGLVVPTYITPWVFQRRRGYLHAMRDLGLEIDERLILWQDDMEPETHQELLWQYIQRNKPTALLFGSYGLMPPLANLVKENRLRIPEDLSIVHFDQNPECLRWFENVEPTAVTIPLRAMGMKLAHMAREISDKPDQVPSSVAVPCGLQEGNSVRRI